MGELGIGSGMGFSWIINLLILTVFVGGFIWLIVWGIRRFTEPRASNVVGKSPLDIVKDRYARRDITKEQFEQLKKDLA
jgi:putative membrane protein